MWLNNRARLEVQYIRNYDHHWHDHCQVEYQQSRILRSWPLIIITAIRKNGESYPAVIGSFCRGWCDDVLDLQAWHGIVVARSCHLKYRSFWSFWDNFMTDWELVWTSSSPFFHIYHCLPTSTHIHQLPTSSQGLSLLFWLPYFGGLRGKWWSHTHVCC